MDSTKGFIYPAVLFVSALVLLIVNFTAAQYISRCMFEKETKRVLHRREFASEWRASVNSACS